MTTETQSRADIWSRLSRTIGHLLGFGLRLVFVLLLAVGLGAGVYFGVPWIYRTAIEPVQRHTVELALLSNRVDHLRDRVDGGQAAQDERLTALETGSDALRDRTAAAATAVAELEATLAGEVAAREALAAELAALQAENATLAAANDALTVETGTLRDALDDLDSALATTSQELAALQQQVDAAGGVLRVRIVFLRARVQLLEDNFGAARQSLTAGSADLRALLEGLTALSAEEQIAFSNRLTAAEKLIQEQPAAALEELESILAQLDRTINADEAPPTAWR